MRSKRIYTLIIFLLIGAVYVIYLKNRLPVKRDNKASSERSPTMDSKGIASINESLQQTCQSICHAVPEVPIGMERLLIQVGDVPIVPDLDRENTPIDYIVSPSLPGGAWAHRNRGDSSEEKCPESMNTGVAVIIVCNDRWHQLNVTLYYLIPLLQKQRLCYRIFVVEQKIRTKLNKAMLLNVGFTEAAKRFRFHCVVFQDADLAPINDLNPYGCDSLTDGFVVHLGVGLDNRQYRLNYESLVGGVLKFSKANFLKVNGFSNMYWGWGQEDDDMAVRIKTTGLSYIHMVNRIARYHAVPHTPQPKTKIERHKALLRDAGERIKQDGLSTLTYHLTGVFEKPFYLHLLVDLPDEVED